MKRLFAILIALFLTITIVAQTDLAAVIEIRAVGVEIQRPDSDLWLPLPLNAVAFIGAGDTIRTNETGRVDIQFSDTSHVLLLSNSDFTITTFSESADGLTVDAVVNGNAVVETADDTPFADFNLQLNDLQVTSPASLMALWSFPDVTDVVTVAGGTATVNANDTDISVPAESGFFAEPNRTEAVMFDPEWHAAGLEADLYGCEGEVQTAGNVPLLVRTGPGQGFQAMGTLDVSRVVPLMGMTETTQWTRIQFLTGFGWIRSLAIQSDCTDLEIFPDDAPEEKFITLVNVRDGELAILQPFFQTPASNGFVYKVVANP